MEAPATPLIKLARHLYSFIDYNKEPPLLMLRQPLKFNQALKAINPKNMPTIEPPHAPWIALIAPPRKKLPTLKEIEYKVSEQVSEYYIEEYTRYLKENELRGKKARWALKTRSYFRNYIDPPDIEDLWPYAVAIAKLTSELMDINIKSRVHSPTLLFATLLLKYAITPLSFRKLAKLLKKHKLSTGAKVEAYASKSTLHRAFQQVKLEAINAAMTMLYLLIHSLWCYRLKGAVSHILLYATDTSYVVLDGYVTRFVKGVFKDVKGVVKVTALVWIPENCVVAVVSSAKAISSWIKLLPQNSLLIGDKEFYCRELLLACVANRVKVAIPSVGSRKPIGLSVDVTKYWARKLCERVFGAIERRGASTLRFRSVEAGRRAVLLAFVGHNLVRLWVSGRLFDAFEVLSASETST